MKQLFLMLSLFACHSLLAQKEEKDALVLYDSRVLVGEVVERDQGGKTLFMRQDSIFLSIQTSNIYKEMKVIGSYSSKAIKNAAFEPSAGLDLAFIIEPGFAFSRPNDQFTSLAKIDVISSLTFKEVVSLGFGAGVRLPLNSSKAIVPVFADLRLTTKKRVGPILALTYGHGFSTEAGTEDYGVLGQIKLGVVTKNFRGGSIAVLFGFDFGNQEFESRSSLFGSTITSRGRGMVNSGLISIAFTV